MRRCPHRGFCRGWSALDRWQVGAFYLMEQITLTPRVALPALTCTSRIAMHSISVPLAITIGLFPVSRYDPGGSDSRNRPFLLVVTTNCLPSESMAIT
jgi:hypothetical protein